MMRAYTCQLALLGAALLSMTGLAASDHVAGAAISRSSAQATDQEWTDAYRQGDGIAMPRLVHQARPSYTAAAMREKIQGTVRLQCVVEDDGAIRRVRVTGSLDARWGLDREAIAAVKKWKFQPGTKDGRPVPVVVTIELSFTLRDGPPKPAPLTWPEAFSAAAQGAQHGESIWDNATVQVSPFMVGVGYPKDWVLVVGPPRPEIAVMVMLPDASWNVAMMTPPPPPASMDLRGPGTHAELQAAAAVVADAFKRPVAAVGQTRIAGRLWLWLELGVVQPPAGLVQELPGARAASNQQWIFTTPVEGTQVILAFSIAHKDGMERNERTVLARRAGATFAQILERMSFKRMQ